MKKKTIANLVMVIIIIGIVVAGMMGVGHIRGWFDKPSEETALLTEFRGIITLKRDGIAYTTMEDTVLREGDEITCSPGASVKITLGEGYVTLGQSAEVKIKSAAGAEFVLEVNNGEAFVNTVTSIDLEFDGEKVEIKDAVAMLSVRKGAQSISVYYGTVGQAKAGQIVEWINHESSVRTLLINSLNDFSISQIRKANETKLLIFSNAELEKLEAERWEQMHSSEMDANAGENSNEQGNVGNEDVTGEVEGEAEDSSGNADDSNEGTTADTEDSSPEETDTPEENKDPEENQGVGGNDIEESEGSDDSQVSGPKLTCTITIRCDTILDNWSDLDPAKGAYVPEDGCILPVVTVEFTEGETVFNVLERVCKQYDIQLEYSWTPMYDSYYIEGINYLYEFDCGFESGWMYKVNGWFPNYGCSSYKLVGGESIVWCYTCKGLGEDVGAGGW